MNSAIVLHGCDRSFLVKDTTTGKMGVNVGANDTEQEVVAWASKRLNELKGSAPGQYILEVKP